MPIFEIQTSSGTFEVDAPDQQTALDALGGLPSAPPQAENSLAGSAKAILAGGGEGLISLLALPADAIDLATRGVDYLAGTKTNEAVSGVKKFGSENIKKLVEERTGEFYKPQTTTEKFLSTTAGFAPLALAGPGGVARRVGQVVAPGVLSEAAGQLTEGSDFEPVARVAGALGGAVGASKAASALKPKNIAPVPTRAELAKDKTAGYQGPASKALEIDPVYGGIVADSGIAALKRGKFSQKDPGVATVYGLMDDLRNPEFGKTHRIQDFDNTRKQLNDIAGRGGSEGTAAIKMIRTIDAATLRVPQRYVVAGDAKAAAKELFAARKNAAAGFRSDKVNEFLNDARISAQSTHSGGNLENEIYKKIAVAIKRPKVHLRGWSDEEKAALAAVLPGLGRNLLRRSGKLLGGGGGLGQLASGAAGGSMFGFPGMFVLPALGMGANRAGIALAESKLKNVDELIRSRSPAYGAANMAHRQAMLQGGGILGNLPPREQLALQALIAARLQPPDYAGR